MSSAGAATTTSTPTARRSTGSGIEPRRGAAGRLGQELERDADRHPHDGLRRDRRRGVVARRGLAELVLDDDEVDVLQEREQREAADRGPRAAHEVRQRLPRGRAGGPADPPADDERHAGAHHDEAERRAEERAGDPEAEPEEQQAAREARERLDDERAADRAEGVDALQHAALEREQEPQRPGRQDPRAAARGCSGTPTTSAIGWRRRSPTSARATVTPTSWRDHAASVALSRGPSPRRCSAVSRAAATWRAWPPTRRMRKALTSAARVP